MGGKLTYYSSEEISLKYQARTEARGLTFNGIWDPNASSPLTIGVKIAIWALKISSLGSIENSKAETSPARIACISRRLKEPQNQIDIFRKELGQLLTQNAIRCML